MPFTPNLGLSVQATGSDPGTWGADNSTPTAGVSTALNEGVIQLLDQKLGRPLALSLSSSNVSLTQVQAQNGMIRCTGTLLANVTVSPAGGVLWNGIFCWENVTTGNFTVTIQNSAGSVVLPQGRRGLLWIDTINGPRTLAVAGSVGADPVPSGTVLTVYNTAAPAGYSIVPLDDHGLKVVSSGGGVASGSRLLHAVFAHGDGRSRHNRRRDAVARSLIPDRDRGQPQFRRRLSGSHARWNFEHEFGWWRQ
jgi:hypothetical protein